MDMPKWPELATYRHYDTKMYEWVHDFADYHRARAEAAIARLKVAKPALDLAAMTIGCACACIRCKTASDRVHEAIALIGHDIGQVPNE